MPKIIAFNPEAQSRLKKGVDKLANAVKTTLGPQGRNVIIEKKFGAPHVTKDGVTVAENIDLKDPIENMGAKVVREVASTVNAKVGDGTTTATVITQSIISEIFKSVTTGANIVNIQKGITIAVDKVVENIKKQSKKISSHTEVKQIATISANNDKEIGNMIADLFEKLGPDGVITVEEAKSTNTETKIVEGMQFDKGYLSPYFVTNSEKMIAELEHPYILFVDKKISTVQELVPLLELIAKEGKQLLIIADGIDNQVLTTIVVNRLRGTIKAVAVNSPAFGDRKKAILRDMAIVTGAQVIGGEEGYTLENIQREQLGSAEKVIITKDNTTIVNGAGNKKEIEDRIKVITAQIEQTDSEYDRTKLEERRGTLSGGVGVLSVGGHTELDVKERKDRVNDAVSATRAAIEEGIVPGGGVTFLRAASSLDNVNNENNEDIKRGIKIIQKALEKPSEILLENAVGSEYHTILHKIKEGKADFGYNARNGKFGPLYDQENGVIDPAKVARLVVKVAASAAQCIMTAPTVIAEDPEETKNQMPTPPMGGGMGGMM